MYRWTHYCAGVTPAWSWRGHICHMIIDTQVPLRILALLWELSHFCLFEKMAPFVAVGETDTMLIISSQWLVQLDEPYPMWAYDWTSTALFALLPQGVVYSAGRPYVCICEYPDLTFSGWHWKLWNYIVMKLHSIIVSLWSLHLDGTGGKMATVRCLIYTSSFKLDSPKHRTTTIQTVEKLLHMSKIIIS